MVEGIAKIPAERVVVVMPNWLGDGVMATPFLRALRGLYPGAKIAAVARPLVAPVVSGLGFVDEMFVEKKGEAGARQEFLRAGRFDLGVLLPNSFRSAWGLWQGGVKERLGYARDWRSPLLTRRVRPSMRTNAQRKTDSEKIVAQILIDDGFSSLRQVHGLGGGRYELHYVDTDGMERTRRLFLPFPHWRLRFSSRGYQPVPTIDYYLELARFLRGEGLPPASRGLYPEFDRRMELGVTEAERAEAEKVMGDLKLEISDLKLEIGEGKGRWVTMVPGANFGSSKCWPPEYFAKVADALIEQRDVTVLLASSPAEMPIVEAILAASKRPERVVALAKLNEGRGVSLGALKEMVRRSLLMVCNDTGPRHFAAAFGVPMVTLFGPTDPVWAETFAERERQVRIEVPCGPCQLKKCPIDHRCMVGLGPDLVLRAVDEVCDRR